MINLLFLLATAQASDVYEIDCRETRVWSERYQKFVFLQRECGMMDETIYFMVHKNSLEINQKDIVPISSHVKDGMQCWKEHEKSELCLDLAKNRMVWEYHYRNGKVTIDYFEIARINGEVAR